MKIESNAIKTPIHLNSMKKKKYVKNPACSTFINDAKKKLEYKFNESKW